MTLTNNKTAWDYVELPYNCGWCDYPKVECDCEDREQDDE